MPNWINPFHDSYDNEYHYFSIDNITKIDYFFLNKFIAASSLLKFAFSLIYFLYYMKFPRL